MINYNVLSLSYWMFLVPLTLIGTLANLTLILVWSTKKYKFNRLIIMTIAASGLISMYVYHAWQHTHSWEVTAASRRVLLNVFFTVRQYSITLYVYLSIVQYCFISHLSKPRLISKRRAVCGLLLVGLWVAICRTASILLTSATPKGERRSVLSSLFFFFTQTLPQVPNIYFVGLLLFCVRRYNIFVKRALRFGTPADLDYSGQNPRYFEPKGVSKSEKFASSWIAIRSLFASSSSVSDVSAVPQDSVKRKMLNPRALRHFVMKVRLELHMAKSVIILCIPPVFIYGIGFSATFVGVYNVELHSKFFNFIDILQFVNFSLPLFVLFVMVPSFKQLVKRKIMFRSVKSRRQIRKKISRITPTTKTPVIPSASGSSNSYTSSLSAGSQSDHCKLNSGSGSGGAGAACVAVAD